jgi:hypothetical protein
LVSFGVHQVCTGHFNTQFEDFLLLGLELLSEVLAPLFEGFDFALFGGEKVKVKTLTVTLAN